MKYPIFRYSGFFVHFKFIFKFLFVIAWRKYFNHNVGRTNTATFINFGQIANYTNIRLKNSKDSLVVFRPTRKPNIKRSSINAAKFIF